MQVIKDSQRIDLRKKLNHFIRNLNFPHWLNTYVTPRTMIQLIPIFPPKYEYPFFEYFELKIEKAHLHLWEKLLFFFFKKKKHDKAK